MREAQRRTELDLETAAEVGMTVAVHARHDTSEIYRRRLVRERYGQGRERKI